MHTHVNEAVDWKMKSICSTDHLAVIYEPEVRGGHGVVVLIALIGHVDKLPVPLVVAEVLLYVLFTS